MKSGILTVAILAGRRLNKGLILLVLLDGLFANAAFASNYLPAPRASFPSSHVNTSFTVGVKPGLGSGQGVQLSKPIAFPFHHHHGAGKPDQASFTGHQNIYSVGSGSAGNPTLQQLLNTSNVSSAPALPSAHINFSTSPQLQSLSTPQSSSLTGHLSTSNNYSGPIHLHSQYTSSPTIASGTALDLNSNQASIAAPNTNDLQIVVGGQVNSHGVVQGGTTMIIQAGQQLTPAQYVAVSQVINNGRQTIVLAADGSAAGGVITLSGKNTGTLSTLDVPKNVTLDLVGFKASDPLVVSGATDVSGSIYVMQGKAASSTLDLGSLTVASGGTISTGNAPKWLFNNRVSSSLGTLTISTDASIASQPPSGSSIAPAIISSPNLSPNTGNITNSGAITDRAGNLTLSSAGSITNNSGATIQAANNVNLTSQTGNFTNSGLISAKSGNVNFSTGSTPQDITLTNNNGTVQATHGAINFRDPTFSASNNLTINGGNFYSQQVNLNSGAGTVNANMGQVTGIVNVNSASAHVVAATPNLRFGTLAVSGDPTYYNTTGSITLASAPSSTGGNDLAFIASQDVVIQSGSIDTTNAGGGNGGALTIVAGANITAVPSVSGGQGGPDSSTTFTVNGASTTGGAIILTGTGSGSTPSINTPGTGGNSSGGAVTLVAYTGTGVGSTYTPGTVVVPNAINTGSAGSTGTNGSVTVIAGATSGTGISIPNGINTNSGTSTSTTGGAIALYTATPTISGTLAITNGSIVSGSFGAGATSNSSINVGALTTLAAPVSITAGGSITTGVVSNTIATGNTGAVTLIAGTSINGGLIDTHVNTGAGNAGAISLTAGTNITLTGNLVSTSNVGSGGAITVNAGGSVNAGFMQSNILNSTTGSSGAITVTAGGSVTAINLNTSEAGATSGNSGNITVTAGTSIALTGDTNASAYIDVSTPGSTGNCGTVQLVAGTSIALFYNGVYGYNNGSGNAASYILKAGTNTSGNIILQSSAIGAGNGGTISVTAGGNIAGLSVGSSTTSGTPGAVTVYS